MICTKEEKRRYELLSHNFINTQRNQNGGSKIKITKCHDKEKKHLTTFFTVMHIGTN